MRNMTRVDPLGMQRQRAHMGGLGKTMARRAQGRGEGDVEIGEAGRGLVASWVSGIGEGGGGGAGREFRVVLIREGLAKSGRYFTRGAVEQIAEAAEGLRAFA